MSDSKYTLRSKYYTRAVPFSGKPQSGQVKSRQDDTLREIYGKIKSVPTAAIDAIAQRNPNESGPVTTDALLEANPWLSDVLDEVIRARLSLLSSKDKWANDKDYGWIEGRILRPKPEEAARYFDISDDDEHPLVLTDAANGLIIEDPEKFEKLYGEMLNYRARPYRIVLSPGTRKEAEANSNPWYPSTNEYLTAMTESGLVPERYKKALFGLASQKLAQRLEDEYKKGDPSGYFDIPELSSSDKISRQFGPGSSVLMTAMNSALPFASAVMWDPELRRKTSVPEFLGRGAADIGLFAASVALPELAAARGAMMAGRAVGSLGPRLANIAKIGGSVAGGASGGTGHYLLQRGANEGFDLMTGHGGIEYPIDLRDLALDAAVSGVTAPLSGTAMSGKRAIQEKMLRGNPSKVTGRHIKEMSKAFKETMNPKEAVKTFTSMPYDRYRLKFPESGEMVEFAPKPEAYAGPYKNNVPLLPLEMGMEKDAFGRLKPSTEGLKTRTDKPGLRDKFVKVERRKTIPYSWAIPNEDFIRGYKSLNSDYFVDFPDVDKLGTVLSKAQEKSSPLAELFTGKTEFVPSENYAKKKAEYLGKSFFDEDKGTNKFAYNIYNRKSTPANRSSSGEIYGLSKKQKKAYDKANEEYKLRSRMKPVSETDIQDARKTAKTNSSKAGGGIRAAYTLSNNVMPWGSYVFGDTDPYLYYIADDTENKEQRNADTFNP